MKKRTMILTLAAGSLVLGLGLGFAQMGQGRGPGAGRYAAATATQTLSKQAADALLEALSGPEGEYAAYAMYTAVIDKYGDVEPYVSIRKAEARHIEALKRQLDRYGVVYPAENPYLGQVSAPASLEEAAKAWAKGEVANVAMYDRLMGAVADYPNLVRVFDHLRAASQERHLPAFSLAAEKGGTLSPEQMQELHGTFASQRGQGQQGQGGRDCQRQGQGRGQGHGPHGGAGPHSGSSR